MPRGEDDIERLERIDRLVDEVIGVVWKPAAEELSALPGVIMPSASRAAQERKAIHNDRGQPGGFDLELAIEREVPVLGEIYSDARVWLNQTAATLAADSYRTPERADVVSILQSIRIGTEAGAVWGELAALQHVRPSADSGDQSKLASQVSALLRDLEVLLSALPSEVYTLVAFPIHVAHVCTNREVTRRLAEERLWILQHLHRHD